MTTAMRNSATHPLAVDSVAARPGHGRIGLVACPGRHDPGATGGGWARDLASDLDALRAWGAAAVTTLVGEAELALLGVAPMGRAVTARGMTWIHLPIVDMSVPDMAFEHAWRDDAGPRLHALLAAGRDIVLHCRAGRGRTGMIAARLLVEAGTPPDAAIRIVRAARPGAIETASQEAYVRRLQDRGASWPELRSFETPTRENRSVGLDRGTGFPAERHWLHDATRADSTGGRAAGDSRAILLLAAARGRCVRSGGACRDLAKPWRGWKLGTSLIRSLLLDAARGDGPPAGRRRIRRPGAMP